MKKITLPGSGDFRMSKEQVESLLETGESEPVKTITTKIIIKTDVFDEKDLADENIERYKRNVYETIQNNVDDNAKIGVNIEIPK